MRVSMILSALRAGLGWGRGAQSEDYVQVQGTLVVNTADNIDGPPGIAAKTNVHGIDVGSCWANIGSECLPGFQQHHTNTTTDEEMRVFWRECILLYVAFCTL